MSNLALPCLSAITAVWISPSVISVGVFYLLLLFRAEGLVIPLSLCFHRGRTFASLQSYYSVFFATHCKDYQ